MVPESIKEKYTYSKSGIYYPPEDNGTIEVYRDYI